MAYFNLLVGLRGCYSDSSETGAHMCANAEELHALIAEKAEWYAGDSFGHESDLEPCTLDEAAAEYSIPESGVIVNISTESEYSFESLYAFTMPNGLTYRGAATVLAYVPALGV